MKKLRTKEYTLLIRIGVMSIFIFNTYNIVKIIKPFKRLKNKVLITGISLFSLNMFSPILQAKIHKSIFVRAFNPIPLHIYKS